MPRKRLTQIQRVKRERIRILRVAVQRPFATGVGAAVRVQDGVAAPRQFSAELCRKCVPPEVVYEDSQPYCLPALGSHECRDRLCHDLRVEE